ncbi:hypothetical protein C8J56DRAFT_1096916 [Mycena floridula]|nr:hypothetical protein C8J56DRAFT_1096916 [Mycena floridula]
MSYSRSGHSSLHGTASHASPWIYASQIVSHSPKARRPRRLASFADLFEDIYLELVRYLSFKDGMAFSMVTRRIHNLSMNQASFFMNIIKATSGKRPLPIPRYQSLELRSPRALRSVILQSLRFDRNFSYTIPRILRPVTSFPVGIPGSTFLLFQIPGTPMIVTFTNGNSASPGSIFCWDTSTHTMVAQLAVGNNVEVVADPIEGRDNILVGISVMDNHNLRQVNLLFFNLLTVGRTGSGQTRMKVLMQVPFPVNIYEQSWVLSHELFASVSFNTQGRLEILTQNHLDSRRSTVITTNVQYDPDSAVKSMFYKGDLFILVGTDSVYWSMHCIPGSLLPYQSNRNASPRHHHAIVSPKYLLQDPMIPHLGHIIPSATDVIYASPHKGRFVAFVVAGPSPGEHHDWNGYILVEWDVSQSRNNPNHISEPLRLQVHRGETDDLNRMLFSSPTPWNENVIFRFSLPRARKKIYLMSHIMAPPRVLALPDGISARRIEGIAFDDSAGSLIMLDDKGTVFLVCFA